MARNIYGGYSRNTDRDGTTRDRVYAGLGGYEGSMTRVNDDNGNTSYHAGVDMPRNILPDYFNEVNTPLGSGYLATNFPEANIEAGFMPNKNVSPYISALARALLGVGSSPMEGLANILGRTAQPSLADAGRAAAEAALNDVRTGASFGGIANLLANRGYANPNPVLPGGGENRFDGRGFPSTEPMRRTPSPTMFSNEIIRKIAR